MGRLFEAADGWRDSLWVTNLPERTPGWRGQLAYIDAAHRVHARVEDGVRTGKDTGIGKFPSHALAAQSRAARFGMFGPAASHHWSSRWSSRPAVQRDE